MPPPDPQVRNVVGVIPNEALGFQQRHLLPEVETALSGGGTVILTDSSETGGLGGTGKTQLAAALARQLASTTPLDALVWVTATSRDAIVTAYIRAGRRICGSDASGRTALHDFMAWLTSTTARWLVVLDDLADPADLAGLWPPRAGRVVVTTRREDPAFAKHGHVIPVGMFSPDESHSYLSARLRAHRDLLDGSEPLAAEVGHAPLMLSLAAGYLTNQEITCAEYRSRLVDSRSVVARPGARPPDGSGKPVEFRRDVTASLRLSLSAADALSPPGLATPMLTALSLLDSHGVPGRVVTAPSIVESLALGSPDVAVTAVANLAKLGLVDATALGGRRVWVHALVQRAARDLAGTNAVAHTASAAADALMWAWPDQHRDPDLAQALRANTAALRASAEDRLWSPGCHDLLVHAGLSLGDAGRAVTARDYFEQLATQAAARLGPDHADTLDARHHLAFWRGAAGDAAGAVAAFVALLADRQRLLDPDNPIVLNTRSLLAGWRGVSGDAKSAVSTLEALLADRQRVLGPDHPTTRETLRILADWRQHAEKSRMD